MAMRTEDDLRAAFSALEQHAPAAARVLPGSTPSSSRFSRGVRSPRAIGWLAGVTATAAVARVVTAVTLPGGTPGAIRNGGVASSPSLTHSALQAKLLAAFSAASGKIVYEHEYSTSTSGAVSGDGAGGQETWYYPGGQARTGQQVRSRTLLLNRDGTPDQDFGYLYQMPAPGAYPSPGTPPDKVGPRRMPGGSVIAKGEIIDVVYGTRTWSEGKGVLYTSDDPSSNIRYLLDQIKDGTWTVTGHATLNGRAAIELSWAGEDHTVEHLWVDANSYLPLKVINTSPVEIQGKKIKMGTTTTYYDFQFLPATPANLAKLTPPIPEGFRQTAEQELPGIPVGSNYPSK